MGNLQTGDTKPAKAKGKSKLKLKGKKGKSDIEEEFVGIIPDYDHNQQQDITLYQNDEPEDKPPPPEPPDTLMVNHSWSTVETEEDDTKKPFTTPISSSDTTSIFTEALTPQAFSKQTVESINSNVNTPNSANETFLHNLALNSFKLNEYRVRQEEEKTKKLSKLGVSKTSQISLDSDPSECFVSDNVEIIRQINDDSGFGFDKSSEIQKSLLKGDEPDENDGQEDDFKVTQMVKRMSDASLANGEYNSFIFTLKCLLKLTQNLHI